MLSLVLLLFVRTSKGLYSSVICHANLMVSFNFIPLMSQKPLRFSEASGTSWMLPNFDKVVLLQPSIDTADFSKADLAFANSLNASKPLFQMVAWSPCLRKQSTSIKHVAIALTCNPNMALTSGNTF